MPGGSLGDTLENSLLDHWLGGPDYNRVATVYLALFTAMPSDSGGGTEVTGAGYTRKAITNNTSEWTAASGGSKSNINAQSFPAATADYPAKILGWALMTATSAGNVMAWGKLVGVYKVITADATTDTFTSASHGYTNGTRVQVENADGALPAGLSENTTYYVIGAATNTFQLSATSGGAAINITDAGTGTNRVALDYSQIVLNGNTVTFPAGSLVISQD
jgi:hypothetical protein